MNPMLKCLEEKRSGLDSWGLLVRSLSWSAKHGLPMDAAMSGAGGGARIFDLFSVRHLCAFFAAKEASTEMGLVQALRMWRPASFPLEIVNGIELAEKRGVLQSMLASSVDYAEHGARVWRLGRIGLRYPLFSFLILSSMTLLISGNLARFFMGMINEYGHGGEDWFYANMKIFPAAFAIVFLLVPCLYFFGPFLLRRRGIADFWECFLLCVPFFDGAVRLRRQREFAFWMHWMLCAGIDLREGMELCAANASSRSLRKNLSKALGPIREGKDWIVELQKRGLISSFGAWRLGSAALREDLAEGFAGTLEMSKEEELLRWRSLSWGLETGAILFNALIVIFTMLCFWSCWQRMVEIA